MRSKAVTPESLGLSGVAPGVGVDVGGPVDRLDGGGDSPMGWQ